MSKNNEVASQASQLSNHEVKNKQRWVIPVLIAMIGGFMSLLIAPALGPTVGGYLVEYVGWRWIFTINIPIGIIGVLLAIFFLPKFEKVKVEKLDVRGAVTVILMLFSLLLALSKGGDWGWTSAPIVLMLLLSLVTFCLF